MTHINFNAMPSAMLNDAIERLQHMGGHSHVELVRAALAGDVAVLLFTDRREPITASQIWALSSPALIVIGDDGLHPTGPTGWRGARTVLKWASAVVVHGSGDTPETYRTALDAARAVGRAVMIESTSAHAHSWAFSAAPKPALIILPREGVHPLQQVHEVAQ